jgi:hypothetical protein
MPVNGHYNHAASHHASDPSMPSHSISATNGTSTHAPSTNGASTNGETSAVSKDEVGWYFVEQYYTTLSKNPEKLHVSGSTIVR